jgi:hypothetical protein
MHMSFHQEKIAMDEAMVTFVAFYKTTIPKFCFHEHQ